MLRLSAKITIESSSGKWIFEKVQSCNIERNIENLTTTCEIVLPRKVKWNGQSEVPVNAGDKIQIELGYNENLELAFLGYIKKVGARDPIIIECEDAIYLLKTTNTIKKTYRKVALKKLLEEQLQGKIPFEILGNIDLNLDNAMVIKEMTVAKLLNKLKEQGITSYVTIVDGKEVLRCGMVFSQKTSESEKKQRFDSDKNMITSSGLDWKDVDDIKIKVKANSPQKNGKKMVHPTNA